MEDFNNPRIECVSLCCFCFRHSNSSENQEKYISRISPETIYSSCCRHINRDYFNEEFLNWNHPNPLPFCKKCLLCTRKLTRMNIKLQDIQNDISKFVNSFTIEFLKSRECPNDVCLGMDTESTGSDTYSANLPIVTKKEIEENCDAFDNGSDYYVDIKQENVDNLDPTEYFTETEHAASNLQFEDVYNDLNSNESLAQFEIKLKSETVEKDIEVRLNSDNGKIRKSKLPLKNRNRLQVKQKSVSSTTINRRRRKLYSDGDPSNCDSLPRRKAALKAEENLTSWTADNRFERNFYNSIAGDSESAENEEISNQTVSSKDDLSYIEEEKTRHCRRHKKSEGYKSSLESGSSQDNEDVTDLERKFQCGRCDKTYKNKYHLMDHERTHDDRKRFQCKLCDTSYAYARTLRQHMAKHTETPNLKIKLKNINGGHRKKEKTSESKEKIKTTRLDCKVCGKVCGSKGMLFYHSQSHKSGVLQVKCELCNKIFKNSLTFQKHKKLHLENNTFTCQSCGKQFKSRSGLKEHEVRHNEAEKAKLEDLFKCDMCSMTFYSAARLKRHSMIHTDERPYGPCEKCGNSFRTSSALKEHIRTHEGTERKSFECETCHKKFTTKSNLSQHMFRHSEDKTFQCPVCPKKFVTRDGLATHSKYHNSEKSFLCDECGKSFWTKTKLKIHYRIHTGDLIPCQYCDKKFDTTTHLKQHYRSHNRKFAEAIVPNTDTHPKNDTIEHLPIVESSGTCALCGELCENQQCLHQHTQTLDPDEPPDSDHNFSSLLLIHDTNHL